jgi:hypothetical protein
MKINLNHCAPGQRLECRNGLSAIYISRSQLPGNLHCIRIIRPEGRNLSRPYRADGYFTEGEWNGLDIVHVEPLAVTTWHAKVSDDHVDSDGVGFWAVYQGEA